jgi:hypothetical protein
MLSDLARQGNLATVPPLIKDAQSQYLNVSDMVKELYVPGAKPGTPYPITAGMWFEFNAQATDTQDALKSEVLKQTHAYIAGFKTKQKMLILLHLSALWGIIFLCAYCWHLLRLSRG